jgi:EmrB/QacA subfamily drug resistance transporter
MERRWKVLLLISVGAFMSFLDAPVVIVAFPAISHSFPTAPQTTIAWILDVYFIGFAGLLVVAGSFADRFGRRMMFLGGMALFSAASLACALAPSVGVLIAARLFQALGAAFVVPAGQALMLAEFPAEQRKVAIGALGAIIGLAVAFAPTIGGLVVDGLNWRWIFYANTIVGVATIAYALSLLHRDEPQHEASTPDAFGALLQTGALALLVLAILKRSTWGWGDIRTLGSIAGAAIAMVSFVWRSARHPAPLVDLQMFRIRMFTVANVSSIVFAIGFYGTTINVVLFLTGVWHYSILQTGLTFLPTGIFGALFGAPAGRLSERYGPRPVACVGGLIAAVGLFVITVSVGAHPHYLRDWFAGSMAYSAGLVIGLTGLIGGAVTSVGADEYARASGINSASRQVGGAIGVALVAAIDVGVTQMFHNTHTAFIVGTCLLLASALLSLGLGVPASGGTSAAHDAMSGPSTRPTSADAVSIPTVIGRPSGGP